ncbi:DUF5696 domain-containing protein [Paenibacillus sp. XY044]|uniref:DUF5696 domain-containing protein n=1 Tax=Paenibacillus sp. XY044 TaxID=2026089 RepID=UPI000B99290B|nr:DUF5696 domain-containing protein [Paenibacillus sp. XY044]OZB94307.1 hypothetical protein CJP46_19075 [Paenibacillus sp. XY044]
MTRKHKYAVLSALIAAVIAVSVPYMGRAEPVEPKQEEAEMSGGQAEVDDVPGNAEPPAAEQVKEDVPATGKAAVQQPAKKVYPVTATRKAVSNAKYTLYDDPKTGNIRIVHNQSKREWLGAPQADRKTTPSNKLYLDSPVHISYTEGSEIVSTYPLKDKELKVKEQKIENGIRVHYEMPSIKLAFAMEYRLREDGFEVTIPQDSIKESGSAHIVSLEPLPFLNAALDEDDGAVLLPDGSGALMPFKKNHPPYYAGYSEPIYGPDAAFRTQSHDEVEANWLHETPPKENIALPLFGIYRNGTGALGIVTEGEYSAKINATPSGIRNIPFYRTSVEFIYRNDDVVFIGDSGKVPFYQGTMIPGDRKVRYVLTEGKQANYIGMAAVYRNYLMEEKGLTPVKMNQPILHLKLFGGIERDEIIGKTFISMTTFEQAKQIIDSYAAKGVTAMDVTFDGWNRHGKYGDQPDHFPVSKPLGGSKGLEDLAGYAKSKGIRLFLSANFVRAFSGSDGISTNKDSVRGMDREVLTTYDYYTSNQYNNPARKFYLLKPERTLHRYIEPQLAKFAGLGVAGVSLDYMGSMLYSDEDRSHETTRAEAAASWRQAMERFKESGAVSVDYGFAYTFGSVDRIDGAPVDSSHFIYANETVPFYQLVMHGLIPYTSSPANLRDDAVYDRLRALEYGAIPTYELTAEETSKLQRTAEDRLLSSAYQDWMDASVQEYEDYSRIAALTMNEQMVNHEKLGAQLFRTTYANGVQVIVNYGSKSVEVENTKVDALNYAVVEGSAS